MAKFGQSFLTNLGSPAYLQELGKAAESISAAPRLRKEKEDKAKATLKMTQALASNDPRKILEVASELAKIPGMEKQALELSQIARKINAAAIQDFEKTGAEATQAAQEARQTQVERERRVRLEDKAISLAQSLSGKSEEEKKALVSSLIGESEENLRKFLASGGKEKTGSKASISTKTVDILEDGVSVKYLVGIDPDTNELVKQKIGPATPDEDSGKPFIETAAGSKLYTEAVTQQRTTYDEISKFDSMIQQAEKIAEEKDSGFVGGIVGQFRDFVVADIAGLGDEITAFRTSLNEVQMKRAIALLPRGPASDRDVQLALNASPDLKDYNEEERIAALRGMRKILQAKQEYLDGKVSWMQVTNDPNAVGYESYAEVKGIDRTIDILTTNYGPVVEELNMLIQAGKFEEAKQLDQNLQLNQLDRYGNPVRGLGYTRALEDRARANKVLERALKNKGMTIEDISYV